jgi:hypothetical protein
MNSGELVKNKRSPKWPAIFLIKGRGGYKPTRNKDRYKPNKNKRPEYLAARPRGGWLFGPEISARRTIVQSDPNHPDLPLRVSFVISLQNTKKLIAFGLITLIAFGLITGSFFTFAR